MAKQLSHDIEPQAGARSYRGKRMPQVMKSEVSQFRMCPDALPWPVQVRPRRIHELPVWAADLYPGNDERPGPWDRTKHAERSFT